MHWIGTGVTHVRMASFNRCKSDLEEPLCDSYPSSGLLNELRKTKAPLGQCTLFDVYKDFPQCLQVCYRNPDMAAVFNVAKNYKD